jgi:hypothetical protein
MLVCLYEDRPRQFTGVKLLLLSLARYCPDWKIRLHAPGLSKERKDWLRCIPRLQLIDAPLAGSGSYNVKPAALLEALDSGADQCLWLDTDVLVNGNLAFLKDGPGDTVIVSQDPWEYANGSSYRCESWGLEAGRSLPGPLNSAVVRISGSHRFLLTAWLELLKYPAYQEELKRPAVERDHNLLSDQDGLSALLASKEFAHIPVRRLKHAAEILQHHGAGAYGLRERWWHLRHGLPPLVHAMGTVKPWLMKRSPSLLKQSREYYESTYLALSPYVHLARGYQSELQEDVGWIVNKTAAAALCEVAAFNRPMIKGTAQAVIHRLIK